jgi:tetratricopeptide (TPR) repeat protein/predicted Ser/Thr protein kinase
MAADDDDPDAPGAPVSWTAAIAAMAPPPETAPADQLERGQTIGRFVVLGLVGRGGMGEVYAAYDPELDRKVAVKVVRARVARSRDDRARLLREAQTIAKLSHPNVVVVYDVGTIDDRVFIAMEFVEGSTLGSWLKAAPRSTREVLAVFAAAGRGLAAAHQAGMVHRDFKPDNVMVGAEGQVRVMDFGLARQLSDDDHEQPSADTGPAVEPPQPRSTKITRTGAQIGSPAYMAPEQFLGRPSPDQRTDQFSFCVALYEALYGERPFGGQSLLALQVSVVEGAVRPAPSHSQVPGWIRRILLRGLAVDPAARFPSVATLLAALANDPARRTRRWALGGATAAVMLVLVAVTHRLTSNQRLMCTAGAAHLAGVWEPGPDASARKATIHRAFAASGRSYAEQAWIEVARLLERYAGRWTAMYTDACQATHVRGEQSAEVLDLRMTCLRERLGNLRALSDVFAAADGNVVEHAVSAAAALPSVDRCADIPLLRAIVRPPEDPATRKRVDDLRGELAQLIALRDSGQCLRATPLSSSLIAAAQAVGYQPLLAETLFASAQLGNLCGDDAEMLQRFREAHAAASAARNDELAAQASALIPSFAINRLGQLVVAREWLMVARGDVARLGRESLADAMLAQAEGMLALTERDYPRALAAADRSIAITRRLLGADDPLTIQWQANKGDWQQIAGRLDEALQTDIGAREHFERVLGRDHPRVALVANNEGEVLNLLGRHREAEAAFRRSAALFRQRGADPILLAWALTGLGRALLGDNQADAAAAPLEEALAIRLQHHAAPQQLAETRFALARALWSRPADRGRALALGASARRDYGEDQQGVDEIDAWLSRTRASRVQAGVR